VGAASASVGLGREQGLGGGESTEGSRLRRYRRDCYKYVSAGPIGDGGCRKTTSFSPQKIVEQIRWHAQSIPDDEYVAVEGLPDEWTPQFIRSAITRQTELADGYVLKAPVEVVGVLAVNADATPVQVTAEQLASATLRTATNEPDVMPQPAEFGTTAWGKSLYRR
jgi:hypothetical protein